MTNLRMFLLATAIFLPLALIALGSWWYVRESSRMLETTRFNFTVNEALNTLQERMLAHERVLGAVLALFQATGRVSRSQFGQFVEEMNLPLHFPSIRAVGFSLKVSPEEMANHLVRARRSVPDYRVWPDPGDRTAFPLLFVGPYNSPHYVTMGFDLFSEPVRREAMIRAMQVAQPVLSGRIDLDGWNGANPSKGAILFMPFYGPGGNQPDTPEEREAQLVGYVSIPFVVDDMLDTILSKRFLCAKVTDIAAPMAGGGVLFADQNCQSGQFSRTDQVEYYGRKWLIEISSTQKLERDIDIRYDILVLPLGLMGAFWVTWLVIGYTNTRKRNLDLEAARIKAEAAHQAGIRFLAAISHDLRQPLQSLGFYVELLAAGQRESKPALGAFATLQGAQRLLDTLTDMAAMESGSVEPTITRFDAAQLLTSLVDEVQGDLALKGLSMRTRLPTVWVETDEVMLGRVVRNLINNAIKYTKKGAILVACRREKDCLVIKVADSGPGIPRDKQDLIFKDYYRLEGDKGISGLGIGLATVSRLTRLLGYRLQVLSRPGMGSSFLIHIPLTRKPDKTRKS